MNQQLSHPVVLQSFYARGYQRLSPAAARPHYHESFELCLVLDGTANFSFKGLSIPVQRGSLMIVPPHCMHHSTTDNRDVYSDIALLFQPTAVSAVFHRYPKVFSVFNEALTSGGRLSALNETQIQAYLADFEVFRQTCLHLNDATEFKAYLQLLGLLGMLADDVNTNGLFRRGESRYSSEFKRITDYMQAHLAEQLTIKQLCDHFFISSPTMLRIFKQTVNMSPIRYMTVLRVNAAIDLLKQDMPISIVAPLVGYHNESSFIRAFRSVKNVTPGKYVKSI